MNKNHSSRQIIIKDNSIVICLILTALLVVACLILAKTAVLGEAGSLYADSIQPQAFRFRIDTQSAQQMENASAAAGVKPEAQNPDALRRPVSPEPEAAKAAPAAPIVPIEKTADAVLPKAGDRSKIDSQLPPEVPGQPAAAAQTVLRTMRGGRHPQYASIVFECTGPIDYSAPRREGREIRLTIKNIRTHLRPYRQYRTFDSWVRLNKTDNDLDVSMGVLPGFVKFSDFLMEDPSRLVINLYD